MNVQEIAIHLIERNDRLRAIDEDKARLIAASMRETGQQTPIVVRESCTSEGLYRVVAGGHRLRAAEINATEYEMVPVVSAIIRQVAGDDEALLLEIDENLIRAELSPLDRATFLAERKRLYEKLHPQTKHGKGRKKEEWQSLPLSGLRFTAATAERVGLSERTIRLAVLLHDKLDPQVRRRLSGTVFADRQDQLLALAEETPERQLEIVEMLLGGNERFPSVKAALDRLLGADAMRDMRTVDDRHYDAFMALWGRASEATKANIRKLVVKTDKKPRVRPVAQKRSPDSKVAQ